MIALLTRWYHLNVTEISHVQVFSTYLEERCCSGMCDEDFARKFTDFWRRTTSVSKVWGNIQSSSATKTSAKCEKGVPDLYRQPTDAHVINPCLPVEEKSRLKNINAKKTNTIKRSCSKTNVVRFALHAWKTYAILFLNVSLTALFLTFFLSSLSSYIFPSSFTLFL